MEAVDVFVLEREVADLREKLAAAEAEIAGKQAVIEASKAAINGQVNDCLKVEDDLANFRATVADALAELRGVINAHDIRLESCDRDGQEFCDCLDRVMAKIAKLGLAESEEVRI